MPRKTSNSSFDLSIDDDFDDTKNYRVKLNEIEERPSTVGKPGQMADIWKVAIYRDDGTAFMDQRTGEVFELWAWTSDSMFANPTTGQRSKGRAYAEAFMGRELTDEEVDDMIDTGFAEALVGKTALGSFEITTNNDGNQRLSVVRLRADKAPTRAAPPPRSSSNGSARQSRIDD